MVVVTPMLSAHRVSDSPGYSDNAENRLGSMGVVVNLTEG